MKSLLLSFLLLLGITASAQIPKPQKNTYVNDLAHVLSEGDAVKLNKRLFALEKQQQVQLAVVLVNKIPAQYDIKTYARKIGKTWKVGKNQRGIVYVAAVRQRKQRLEVSKKLASVFTTEKSQEILTATKPGFKAGKYSAGLAALIEKIDAELIAPEPVSQPNKQPVAAQAAPTQQQNTDEDDGNFWVGAAFIALIIFIIVWFVRRANRRRVQNNQQYYHQNNLPYNNPNNPGYGNQGYGGQTPYNQPPQNNTLRDMATGAIIGGAVGYGARALQDRLADGDRHNQNPDQNHIRPQNTPYRDGNDIQNEPSNWGNWGGGNDNDAGDFSDPSKFTDNSWGDSSSSNDSSDGGWSDSGSSDSGSSDGGGSSDW